jgi:hypothetical protein
MEPTLDNTQNAGMTQIDSGVAQTDTSAIKMPKGGEI